MRNKLHECKNPFTTYVISDLSITFNHYQSFSINFLPVLLNLSIYRALSFRDFTNNYVCDSGLVQFLQVRSLAVVSDQGAKFEREIAQKKISRRAENGEEKVRVKKETRYM